MMTHRTLILLSGCLPLLAACNFLTAPTQPFSDWQAERNWQHFEAEGRLSVRADGRGSYANFDWLRRHGVETIDINTPIGTTVGRLCQDSEGVLAVDAKGKVYRADSTEALSEALIGYPLPLQYLSVWANGEWSRAVPHTIQADGSLQQLGWRIRRQLKADGSPAVLTLENTRLSLRIAFSSSRREAGSPEQQDRCEARTAN